MEDDQSKNPKVVTSYDPGWNDPPVFSYSNVTPKPKNNLNKRVAYPLQSTTLTNQNNANTCNINYCVPPIKSMPPPPGPPLSSIKTTATTTTDATLIGELVDEIDLNSDVTMEQKRIYCINIFERMINDITSNSNAEEIQKRINIMNTHWLENKLGQNIQNQLYKIAKALELKNVNEATSLHRSLMVNNNDKNICAQWGPAIRQLILTEEPKQIQDNSTIINSDNQIPMFGATSSSENPSMLMTNNDNKSSETKKKFSKIYHI